LAFDLIVSQGRAADRTAGAIPGAALTAAMLAERLGAAPVVCGVPSPARDDDWREALPAAGETLHAVAAAVGATLDAGRVPLLVANTCSVSLATLPLAAARADATVLWIDAHGDFNTPDTTGSGYLGGMVVAAACGVWESGHGAGLDPRRVVIVGGRDIDEAEGRLLAEHGVRVVAPADATPDVVLPLLGDDPVWVHVDWDALEPGHVPAAYAVPGGLLPGQVRLLLAALPPERIAGVELAELEATGDAAADARAVATIDEIVAPLLER
jgi:arginase